MAVSHVEWTSRNVSQPRVALMARMRRHQAESCPSPGPRWLLCSLLVLLQLYEVVAIHSHVLVASCDQHLLEHREHVWHVERGMDMMTVVRCEHLFPGKHNEREACTSCKPDISDEEGSSA